MKKERASKTQPAAKTIGTRIVEKYRPKMNRLTRAERQQLLKEGLATIYSGQVGHLAMLIAVDANVLIDLAAAVETVRDAVELERGQNEVSSPFAAFMQAHLR